MAGVEFVLKDKDKDQYIKIKEVKSASNWIKSVVGTVRINDTNNKYNKEIGYSADKKQYSTFGYTSNRSEATKFVTDSNGVIEIQNLLASSNGTDSIKYILEEVNNPTYGYNATVTKTIDKINKGNTSTTVKITNEKQVGELYIKKVDSVDANIKLPGVVYRIKATDKSGNTKYIKIKGTGDNITKDSNGWITKAVGTVRVNDTDDVVNNPTFTYTDGKSNATQFVTDDNSEIYIQNLLTNYNGKVITYQLEEDSNPHYGYTKVANSTVNGIKTGEKTTVTITNEKQVGDVYIKKVDSVNSSISLEGVEYYLNSTNGYVKIKGTGDNVETDANGWATRAKGTVKVNDTDDSVNNPTLKYTNNKDEATIFVTDSKGEIYIQNLLMSNDGKDRIQYTFEEIYNPNYGYTKISNIPVIKLEPHDEVKLTVTNEKQVGDVYIKKVDSVNSSISLEGVEYYLYSTNGYVKIKGTGDNVETDANGWATRAKGTVKVKDTEDCVNNPTLKYTKNKEEATIFVTDSKGELNIQNLLMSNDGKDRIQYTFEEEFNPNYGYTKISNIPIKEIKPHEKVSLKVTNEKQVGDVYIKKVDFDDNSIKLEGVEYYLNSTNGYVRIKTSNGWETRAQGTVRVADTKDRINNPTLEYTNNKEEATVFVTDSKGELNIQNLLMSNDGKDRIQYTFEEIYNPNYGYTKISNIPVIDLEPHEKDELTVTNEKQVGDIYINKVDDRVADKLLPGVEFVLKSSYQDGYIKIKGTGDNVENGSAGWAKRATGTVRVNDTKDRINNPTLTYTTNIEEATKFVTDTNSEIYIKNLLTSSNGEDIITYQLEEVANTNYGYLIDSEKYPIVFKADKTGTVTADGVVTPKRHQTVNITIENHQEYIRIEGYVWEEISTSKSNEIDNLYQDTDALIKGINVYLCKNGQVVATQVTDEDGWYCFGTERPQGQSYEDSDYLTPKNGNLEIDYLDQYSVEFEYDGLRFTSVKEIVEYLNEDYDITSKAKEVPSGRSDRKDRQSVNNDFSEIRYNASTKYTLHYDFANNISTYKDYWGYEYNEDKTRLTVTPAKGYYEIIASTKTSGFNLKDAWEARCEKTGEEVLDGINLGIERRAQADLAISSDLNEVNIAINTGTDIYENTYKYAKRNIDGDEKSFGVDIKFGTATGSYSARGLNLYTRRIYESDLAYIDNMNNPQLMKIYVTYKIRVKNQSTKLTSEVNEIVNYYDERYEISDSWLENGTKVNWTGNSGAGSGYKAGYTNAIANTEIAAGGYIDIYIKFRLNNDAVKTLIEKQTTLNNVSEISAFSTVEGGRPYAAIDEDSNPGSAKITLVGNAGTTTVKLHEGTPNERTYEIENKTLDTTTYEDDTDMAPSLILGIEDGNPTRGLSGTVFEDEDSLHNDDNTHPGEERLGDGILGNDKHRIVGAKVELLNEDGTLANLYQFEVTGGIMSVKEPLPEAVTYTNGNSQDGEYGEYQFLGVIPGRYLIRYTYDANTYIVDENGNKIKDIDPRDYKSTIITSDLIKTALNLNKEIVPEKEERMGNLNWILPYEGKRYSDAVDDITKRETTDNVYYGNLESTNLVMTADTAFFDVGVEYSDVESDKPTSEGFNGRVSFTDYKDEYNLENGKVVVLDVNGKLKLIDTFYAVNPYQDFGIVERPRQVYDVNKRVSNFKVTLANGQILINGNPYSTEIGEEYAKWNEIEKTADPALQYVKALPSSVIAEIDNEIIQGATLSVEYTISIKNDSEIDYIDKSYYYYGTDKNNKLTSVIKKVVDYMEDDLVYNDEVNASLGWNNDVNAEKLVNWDGKQLISTEVHDNVTSGYTIAVTEKFAEGIEPGTVTTVQIYGSKLLATNENGIGASNHVEIIETTRHLINPNPGEPSPTPGNYNPTTGSPNEPDDGKTRVGITPPTGLSLTENTSIFMITAVAITLVVLAGGIIFINQKILR